MVLILVSEAGLREFFRPIGRRFICAATEAAGERRGERRAALEAAARRGPLAARPFHLELACTPQPTWPDRRIARLMENSEYRHARGLCNVEDDIRKSRNYRASDIAI